MDEMSNKAILIAAGLFVTLMITSSALLVLDQIKTIYSQVYETNISLQDTFSEFDEYDNTQKTGIDLLNTLKKYRDNNNVVIKLGTAENTTVINKELYINGFNTNIEGNNIQAFSTVLYNTTVDTNNNTGITTITFTII